MARTVEVNLKLNTSGFQTGAREIDRQATALGNDIKRTSEQTNKAIREQAELTAKIAEKHAENVAKAMQKWREGAEILSNTSQILAGMGAIITGSILQSINAYVQNAGKAEVASKRWLTATEGIAASNQRIGRVATQAVLPILEKAADVAEKAAAFAERNPEVISGALKIGAAMTALGAVGIAVSKGIRLYTDMAELSAHLIAARLQKQAADQQLAAAGIQVKAIGARVAGVGLAVTGGVAAGFLGHEALAQTEFGQSMGMQAGTAGKAVSLLAYGLGSLVGKGNEAFQAVARWTGQLQQATNTAQQHIQSSQMAGNTGDIIMQMAAERAAATTRARDLMKAAQNVVDIEKQMAAERRAIQESYNQDSLQAEREAARNRQLEALQASWAAVDAERQAAQERLQIQQQYQQAVAQAQAAFAQAQAQAAQSYARTMEDIERNYQQQIANIQRQYEEDEFEATLNRDASALYRARRQRDQNIEQAQQNRTEQQRQAEQNYQDALNAAQQAYQESLAQAEQAQAASLAQLEQSIQDELAAQALADERERQEQALQESWLLADRQQYLQQQYTQVVAAYSAELQAAQNYYSNLAQMQESYQATYTSIGGTIQAYANGGYTVGGMALLHPGEFVLNPRTTRVMENALGVRLTQQNVQNSVSLGGVNVNGMGLGAREVARIAARQVEIKLLEVLEA